MNIQDRKFSEPKQTKNIHYGKISTLYKETAQTALNGADWLITEEYYGGNHLVIIAVHQSPCTLSHLYKSSYREAILQPNVATWNQNWEKFKQIHFNDIP